MSTNRAIQPLHTKDRINEMAFQAVPRGVKIELNAVQNDVPIVNVWYAQLAGAPTDADLLAISEAVETWWHDNLKPSQHGTYVVQNITVTDVSIASGHQHINASIFEPMGGAGDDAAAANAAAVISWRTAATGRSFRGRTYIGGLPQAALVDAQHLTTAAASAYNLAGANLVDALEAVGATLVVVSRIALGVVRIIAVATEIIAWVTDNRIDSQRRRTAN